MLEAIPLDCAVSQKVYQIVKSLLGEDVAELLLYEPPPPVVVEIDLTRID